MQACVDSLSKKDAAKVHPVLLPLVAKAANDPAPEVREANMEVLVSFALKAANLALLEKVCLCPTPSYCLTMDPGGAPDQRKVGVSNS
jgi:hypothetical protein